MFPAGVSMSMTFSLWSHPVLVIIDPSTSGIAKNIGRLRRIEGMKLVPGKCVNSNSKTVMLTVAGHSGDSEPTFASRKDLSDRVTAIVVDSPPLSICAD